MLVKRRWNKKKNIGLKLKHKWKKAEDKHSVKLKHRKREIKASAPLKEHNFSFIIFFVRISCATLGMRENKWSVDSKGVSLIKDGFPYTMLYYNCLCLMHMRVKTLNLFHLKRIQTKNGNQRQRKKGRKKVKRFIG